MKRNGKTQMKRNILLALAALLLTPLAVLHGTDAPKPNIVLIFIDDMGYADITPFGNTQVRTPNLDKFATEGMKFTSFYAAPVCSMSRAALMTGCYNTRVSIPGVLFPKDNIGLNPDEITLAEIVKPMGYATCAIGKWHLGHHPEFLPTRQGFDHYFGLPYSNDMGSPRKGYPPLPLINDEKVIETEPDQSELTRRYTEEAITFIRDHQGAPFFVYLPHTMIHNPLAASEGFKGKSKLGLLGDAIEEIDWSVGQIMATLKELQLDDNTLVIFTSDNGPAGHRAAPPFRGHKGTNFEGGVRVPCIMRWPGKIPAGTSCNQIVGNIDMLPTFAKIAGADLPKDRLIDGREITSLMFDPKAGPVRDTQLYFFGLKLVAIRQGDWKLFLNAPGDDTQAQSNAEDGLKGKPADGKKRGGRSAGLYNLASDPGEANDVAAEHPDIVAKMSEEARKRGAEIQEHKRPPGQHGAG
jgi:arylsulfatase A-like enzyme